MGEKKTKPGNNDISMLKRILCQIYLLILLKSFQVTDFLFVMCLILRARCCLQGKLGEVFVMQNWTFVEMIDFSAGPLIVICLRPYTLELL